MKDKENELNIREAKKVKISYHISIVSRRKYKRIPQIIVTMICLTTTKFLFIIKLNLVITVFQGATQKFLNM